MSLLLVFSGFGMNEQCYKMADIASTSLLRARILTTSTLFYPRHCFERVLLTLFLCSRGLSGTEISFVVVYEICAFPEINGP